MAVIAEETEEVETLLQSQSGQVTQMQKDSRLSVGLMRTSPIIKSMESIGTQRMTSTTR